MKPEPFNPYAPPAPPAPSTHSAARRRIGGEVAVRVVAVIAGFSLVADPLVLPGIATPLGQALGGHVFARGIGLILLAVGFVPWPGQRHDADGPASTREARSSPEEL